jgi:hypothetical protein
MDKENSDYCTEIEISSSPVKKKLKTVDESSAKKSAAKPSKVKLWNSIAVPTVISSKARSNV